MSDNRMPRLPTEDSLKQLPVEQLVARLMQQQRVIELRQQEVERLKVSAALDSQTSSLPPSPSLLKKPTKAKQEKPASQTNKPKRKPGGQPGHEGKTRKGFGRIDRYQVLRPEPCSHCGSSDWESEPVTVWLQQVAQLVERPLEVVEYLRHCCRCQVCGQETKAAWPAPVIPGQDLDAGLQALLGWLGNYAHLSYEKQAELLWELGQIEVGEGTLATTNSRVAQTLASSDAVFTRGADG